MNWVESCRREGLGGQTRHSSFSFCALMVPCLCLQAKVGRSVSSRLVYMTVCTTTCTANTWWKMQLEMYWKWSQVRASTALHTTVVRWFRPLSALPQSDLFTPTVWCAATFKLLCSINIVLISDFCCMSTTVSNTVVTDLN